MDNVGIAPPAPTARLRVCPEGLQTLVVLAVTEAGACPLDLAGIRSLMGDDLGVYRSVREIGSDRLHALVAMRPGMSERIERACQAALSAFDESA